MYRPTLQTVSLLNLSESQLREDVCRKRKPIADREAGRLLAAVQVFVLGCLVGLSVAPAPGLAQQQPVVVRLPTTADDIPSPYPSGEPKNTNVLIRLPNQVADGKRDASTAIQHAIDQAALSSGIVELPPGRYYIATTLKLRANVTLLGALPNQTFLEDRGFELPPVERSAAHAIKPSSVLIQADNLATMIVAHGQDGALCRNVAVRGLDFVVEGGENNKNRQFIDFLQCQDVYVGHCSFDSSSKAGKFGMFHQVDFTQCDGTTCIHNRFHNGVTGTGVNGASSAPALGKRGYFAMNLVTEYVDTGIGLWTGAHDCLVERNVLRGYSSGTDPFAVGVDCDGPHHCTIRRNSIVGGQIGVRLFDCHNGEYPISAVTIADNLIAGQRDNPNGNPAACIKVVHQISPAIKQYKMDFDIRDNHFTIVTRGIMMWSYAKRGSPHWCSPGIRGNTFVRRPDDPRPAVTIGGFNSDGQYVFQARRNDFLGNMALRGSDLFSSLLTQYSKGNPLIKVND